MREIKVSYSTVIFAIILCFALLLIGCSLDEPSYVSDIEGDGSNVMDYVDPATGVHYLMYSGYGHGGMSVRYNADGTIMTDNNLEGE